MRKKLNQLMLFRFKHTLLTLIIIIIIMCNVGSLMTPLCYTRLFTTLLVVITIFLVTMSFGFLLSDLGAGLGSLLSSNADS
jgi:uncharacterized membrane protein